MGLVLQSLILRSCKPLMWMSPETWVHGTWALWNLHKGRREGGGEGGREGGREERQVIYMYRASKSKKRCEMCDWRCKV